MNAQVVIAGKSHPTSLRNTFPAYAMAALPLVSPLPIQDVSLLDYAVTHKTVNAASINEINASSSLTANADDTYIIDTRKVPSRSHDLYTSEEQRRRDQYEIDEDNWHEVAFEEINGTSTCRLALHNDWIINHGYAVDGIVAMNLPEQGISGPFKITAIKHILPQKKPVDEDPDDEWEYKPVTGLFTYRSDQVHTLAFASEDGTQVKTLGVTAAHPIFSTTHHDWRPAGELKAGEKVLTYKGEATILSNEHKPGYEYVYNLEVKDLHNFLVGDLGVVVHNGCSNEIEKYITSVTGKTWKMLRPSGGFKVGTKTGCSRCVKYADHNGKKVYFDDNDFPVFEEFATKGNLNNQVIKYTAPDLQGYPEGYPAGTDFALANGWLDGVKSQYGNNIFVIPNSTQVKINNILHTWHHHQDGKTMFLIPSEIHSIKHTGGGAMIKYGLKGAFEGPQF